jgi:hypothetical protein
MNPELELRDIHLPPEPSWWPPAPGWWLLALLLVALGLLAGRLLLRRWRARRRRLALQAEFDRVLAVAEPAARLAAISQLLRRAARVRDPASATLVGSAWLEFLDQACDPAAAFFAQGAGRVLLQGPYRPASDADATSALLEPARRCFLILAQRP